jgi:hypothetical protein
MPFDPAIAKLEKADSVLATMKIVASPGKEQRIRIKHALQVEIICL